MATKTRTTRTTSSSPKTEKVSAAWAGFYSTWPWHGLGGKRTEVRWEDEWTPVEERTLLDGEPL